MKNKVWGVNVIGNQGVNADNDFVIGASDDGKDVVVKINETELSGAEFAILKEIAEGGPTPGGGSDSNGFYHCTETMAEGVPEHKIAEIVDGNYEHIYFNDQMITFNHFGDILRQNVTPDEHGLYKVDGIFSITIDGESESENAITLYYAPAGADFGGITTLDNELYYLKWFNNDMPIYFSNNLLGFSAGWHTESIEKDFSYTLSVGEMYQIMPAMGYDWVKQIISTNNEWTIVPAKEGTVDVSTIVVGEKKLAKGDVVLDASGNLATIKDFVGREVKHQHATNPFAIGDVVSMDGDDYAYFIDTNFDPSSFANLDWDNAYIYPFPTIDLVQTDYEHPQLISVSYIDAETAHGAPLKGRVFLLWSLDNDYLLYVQTEYPEDAQIVADMMGVQANQWTTMMWSRFSDIVLTDIGNGVYRVLMPNGTGSANVTSIDGQNLISACIAKDGKWTKDESEFVPAVTYDRFASVALKKDIPTIIDYANVKNVPIYARKSIRDGELNPKHHDFRYAISLDGEWDDSLGNHQQKGILYFAGDDEKWHPITGGGTKFYHHEISTTDTDQNSGVLAFVNTEENEITDTTALVNNLSAPFYAGEFGVIDGGEMDYFPMIASRKGILMITSDKIQGATFEEIAQSVASINSDTVTEL